MILQIQILIFLSAALSSEAACKDKDAYTNARGFKKATQKSVRQVDCPRGTAVRVIDVKCRSVYCIDYKEEKSKRSKKNCIWRYHCNPNKRTRVKLQKSEILIPRQVHFNMKAHQKLATKLVLYCCKEACNDLICKNFRFKNSIIDAKRNYKGFLNDVLPRPRKNPKSRQYCEAGCAAVPPVATKPPICGGVFSPCTNDASCCLPICNLLVGYCEACKVEKFSCDRAVECCSNKCIGSVCVK